MAFATLQATMMYPHFAGHTYTLVNGASISTSGKYAIIFRAPATGSISSVAFFVESAGALITYAIQFMNANEAANPDGVIDQQVTFTDILAGGNHMVRTPKITTDGAPGSAGRSVTKGELVSCIITTPGDLANTILPLIRVGDNRMAHEARARAVTQSIGALGVWVNTAEGVPIYAINYKNLGWINNGPLNFCNDFGDYSISVSSVPNEAGIAFTLKTPMAIDGYVFCNAKASITGTIRVALYDTDGATTFTAVDMRTVWGQTTSLAIMLADFGGNFTLTSSVTYFIGIRALGIYTHNSFQYLFSLTEITAASPYGENYWRAERTNLGAWTIVKDKIPVSALRVTGLGGVGGATTDVSLPRMIGKGY